MADFGIVPFGLNGVIVTGVTASGTTDNLGAYSSVNIETVLNTAGITLPPEVMHIRMRITNSSTSAARWCGVRTNGKTNPVVLRDFIIGGEDNFVIVPLNPANKLIDFYAEAVGASGAIFTMHDGLVGIVSDDIDGTLTTITSTVGLQVKTVSAMPADSTIYGRWDTSGKWCPTAETVTTTNNLSGFQYLLLDASKQLKINSSGTFTIFGYWPAGIVTWETPWLSGVDTPTADSTFHDSSFIKTGKKGLFGVHDESSTPTRHDARPKGSTRAVAPASNMSASYNSFFTGVDSNGESQTWLETGGTGNFYYFASFDEFTGSASAVIAPDEITPGETFSVIPTDFAGALTSATLTDAQGNTLTLSVTSDDITQPALAPAAPNLLLGTVSISVTDGTTSASDDTDYIPSAGDAYTNVASPIDDGHSIASLLLQESPPMVIDTPDQLYYPTAYSTSIAANTQVTSNLTTGFVTVYWIVGDDHDGLNGGDVYQIDYYFGDAPSIVVSGLTTAGLTSAGLTNLGLTTAGL